MWYLTLKNSDNLLDSKIEERLIAGVDEAGRGPLAGSVVAAAVILDPAVKVLTDGVAYSANITSIQGVAMVD